MGITAPGFIGAVALSLSAVVGAPCAGASAAPCPDVEVVFARGSAEPAGIGQVGGALVDALRARLPTKSVAAFPVDYPASNQFDDPGRLMQSVVDGVRDAAAHLQATAANCPDTRIVLGGFSQGAVVAGFVTSSVVPDGVSADRVPAPLPPEMARHIAAVTLFGMPSAAWMRDFGAPPVEIGPLYADKTIQLCAEGDTICNGAPSGMFSVAHLLYPINGMIGEGVAFATNRL